MTKKKKLQFTVKRSKWVRGDKNGSSALLNDRDCMCCLGFAINQIYNVEKKYLVCQLTPQNVLSKKTFLTKMSASEGCANNRTSDRAMTINDSGDLTEQERERRLRRLFKSVGVTVKFVD